MVAPSTVAFWGQAVVAEAACAVAVPDCASAREGAQARASVVAETAKVRFIGR
jgi:hypothetical protein